MEANVRQQDFNSIMDYLVTHSDRLTALIFVFVWKAAHKQSENKRTLFFPVKCASNCLQTTNLILLSGAKHCEAKLALFILATLLRLSNSTRKTKSRKKYCNFNHEQCWKIALLKKNNVLSLLFVSRNWAIRTGNKN